MVDDALAQLDEGRVAIVAADEAIDRLVPADPNPRTVWLSARAAKGMEFDSVIVVEPAQIAAASNGLSLLYVALTRTTDRLAIIHAEPLPDVLSPR